MAIARRDDYLTDAQGRALSGAQVFYCLQPATTITVPPSPLAPVYADGNSDPASNPQITDGFGHSIAYLQSDLLYTLVFVHPLFGPYPVILPDQQCNGGGVAAVGYTPFEQVPVGPVNGTNTVFTLSVVPVMATVYDNYSLVPGVGYTLVGNTITFTLPPQVGDTVFVSGLS